LDELTQLVQQQKSNQPSIPNSRTFHDALFRCYIKDVRHAPDGEMEVKIRIPSADVFEGMKLAFAYQQVLTCQMSKRRAS
jgi:hypothetical protein